jgi:20S proteasome subunit alpha 7
MDHIVHLELPVFIVIVNYIAFLSSYDEFDGYNLHMIEPSGHVYAYHAYAHGKGRSICKSEIERKDFKNMTCRDALKFITKM